MAPALQKELSTITLEQYEVLPEDHRVEVFDGLVYDMASPSQIHQELSALLLNKFMNYVFSKSGKCKIFHAPFDVKISDEPLTIVQPDLMIVCDPTKLDGKRCNGAPDYIIEIVSPGNASDDYIKKLYYYKNCGVREYWIVDPQRKIVTVNYFEGDNVTVQYSFNSVVKVNIYEDLYIDFPEIVKMLDEV